MKEAKITQLKPNTAKYSSKATDEDMKEFRQNFAEVSGKRKQVKVPNRQKKRRKYLPKGVRHVLKELADKLPPLRFIKPTLDAGAMKMATGEELMKVQGGTGLDKEGLYPVPSVSSTEWIELNSKHHYEDLRAAFMKGGIEEVERIKDEILKHYEDCKEIHPEMYEAKNEE